MLCRRIPSAIRPHALSVSSRARTLGDVSSKRVDPVLLGDIEQLQCRVGRMALAALPLADGAGGNIQVGRGNGPADAAPRKHAGNLSRRHRLYRWQTQRETRLAHRAETRSRCGNRRSFPVLHGGAFDEALLIGRDPFSMKEAASNGRFTIPLNKLERKLGGASAGQDNACERGEPVSRVIPQVRTAQERLCPAYRIRRTSRRDMIRNESSL